MACQTRERVLHTTSRSPAGQSPRRAPRNDILGCTLSLKRLWLGTPIPGLLFNPFPRHAAPGLQMCQSTPSFQYAHMLPVGRKHSFPVSPPGEFQLSASLRHNAFLGTTASCSRLSQPNVSYSRITTRPLVFLFLASHTYGR